MEKKNSIKMEDLDLEILKILSEDDRISLRKLAEILEKSPVTIKKRIKGMEKSGVIKDFGLNIDYEKLGFDIIALIEINISKGKMIEVEQSISKEPNIFAVYDLTGDYDAILLARFKTKNELSNLVKKINSYEYVLKTNTHLILNVIKEEFNFTDLIQQENTK